MKFGAVFWVDRTTWPSLREAASRAESAGFDSIWVDAHLLPVHGPWRDPKFEGWTVLTALGCVTERPTLGLLVQPTTFINPAITVKKAVTLDAITNGRVVLGVGAGYYEREHDAFGLEFGDGPRERLDRMEEALTIMRRLISEDVIDHAGPYYRMTDATVAPRPTGRMPILVGGTSGRVMRITARLADMWNAWGTLDELRALNVKLDQLCEEGGRDPRAIERVFMRNLLVRPTAEAAAEAWAALDAHHGEQHTNSEQLQIGGSAETVGAELRAYAEAGFDHVTIPFREPFDYETIESLPRIRAVLES